MTEEVHEQKLEARRSWVRVSTTYAAVFFLFIFGPAIIVALLCQGKYPEAREIFSAILPVSSGIIAYWFAARKNK